MGDEHRPGVGVCLTGDVMTGRGIDQILRHPGDPTLHEPWVASAERYVELAEHRSGPIPRRVPSSYLWGDVLDRLTSLGADAMVVNLETAVTDVGAPWPGKGVHYRMHPANVGYLTAAPVDVAVLANNHVLDWSIEGLARTLETLRDAGIRTVGAGRDVVEAWTPVVVDVAGARFLVLAGCTPSSGVPSSWAAGQHRPGVALLPDLDVRRVEEIASVIARYRTPGDVVVFSIHWGGNWGYEIPTSHRAFARSLVRDAGVDVVHGHSSHHPLGLEVWGDRLILYGCGDLVTDYEGIRGHERYRGALGGLYVPSVDPTTGRLLELRIVPTSVERFRLVTPSGEDVAWLAETLDRESRGTGTRIRVSGEGLLVVDW